MRLAACRMENTDKPSPKKYLSENKRRVKRTTEREKEKRKKGREGKDNENDNAFQRNMLAKYRYNRAD